MTTGPKREPETPAKSAPRPLPVYCSVPNCGRRPAVPRSEGFCAHHSPRRRGKP